MNELENTESGRLIDSPDLPCKSSLTKEKTNQDLLSEHEIRIKVLSNGCVISVGCKSFAFSSCSEGMQELNAYIEDPKKMRKLYNN